MSDQPKPTTGEWTDRQLSEIYSHGGLRGVADAHNAALADEREKLAGKEEFWSACEVGYEAEIQQLRSQRDEAIRLLECKEKELAAAQAAAKKVAYSMPKIPLFESFYNALTHSDTTSLDAAIAEAQKPLVELLGWIRGDALHGRPDIVRQIDAALAKAKEGKASKV